MMETGDLLLFGFAVICSMIISCFVRFLWISMSRADREDKIIYIICLWICGIGLWACLVKMFELAVIYA